MSFASVNRIVSVQGRPMVNERGGAVDERAGSAELENSIPSMVTPESHGDAGIGKTASRRHRARLGRPPLSRPAWVAPPARSGAPPGAVPPGAGLSLHPRAHHRWVAPGGRAAR